MAFTEFNLTDLFQTTWGYRPSNISFNDADGGKNVIQTGDESGNIRFTGSNLINKKSQTGMYGSYYAKDIRGRDVFMPLTLGGLFLPYVWLNVKVAKRIVETPLTERRGSVMELISFDNVQIGVKGFAVNHDGTFPEEIIEDLRKLHDRAESL
ncbi:MAG: DUF6046 domain-containing protein, partial [Chitinophagales bacterium]|nr:DUF6046 domain-containing protein [Chitinophagales bacterium]